MKMKTDINVVLERYHSLYGRIFKEFYPAERAGFTERNQTVNFSKAFEFVCPDSFSWFEVPFSRNGSSASNNHIDAIIINQGQKEIFVVEAKRLQPEKNTNQIADDVTRIAQAKEFNVLKNFSHYTYYGVILVDLWTITNGKNTNRSRAQALDKWGKGFFTDMQERYEKKIRYDGEKIDKILKNALWVRKNFKEGFNGDENVKNHYNLLAAVWELLDTY